MHRETNNAPKSHLLTYSKKYHKLIFITLMHYYLCFIVFKGFWTRYHMIYDFWTEWPHLFLNGFSIRWKIRKSAKQSRSYLSCQNKILLTVFPVSFLSFLCMFIELRSYCICHLNVKVFFFFFLVVMVIDAFYKNSEKVVENRQKSKAENENHI